MVNLQRIVVEVILSICGYQLVIFVLIGYRFRHRFVLSVPAPGVHIKIAPAWYHCLFTTGLAYFNDPVYAPAGGQGYQCIDIACARPVHLIM